MGSGGSLSHLLILSLELSVDLKAMLEVSDSSKL